MSDAPDDDGLLPEPLRTVTPPYRGRFDPEMDALLTLIFLPLLVILLPVLPFILLVWLLGKLLGRG
jgi:hypothetical protein